MARIRYLGRLWVPWHDWLSMTRQMLCRPSKSRCHTLQNMQRPLASSVPCALTGPGCAGQEILRPAVRLKDKATGQCLCEYELEEQPLEERERCSSVVMCRVFRQKLGPRSAHMHFGASRGFWRVG